MEFLVSTVKVRLQCRQPHVLLLLLSLHRQHQTIEEYLCAETARVFNTTDATMSGMVYT